MSVDMFAKRFRAELGKLDQFVPNDKRDPRVWRTGFPAWRPLFASLCLYGHSTGYRLFSLKDFYKYCKAAYTNLNHRTRYDKYFDSKNDLYKGMQQRISVWYESGMADTYLYVCLVEAIEDKSKCGIVLYDARVDWKHKADMIVLVNHQPIRINAFAGKEDQRTNVEARRDATERERKKKTMESSHWNNTEQKTMPVLSMPSTDTEVEDVNGIRLYSLNSINRLLAAIYKQAGVVDGYQFPVSAR